MQSLNFDNKKILYLNFNQDYTCFCVGTEGGFIIYNVEQYSRIFHRSKSQLLFMYNLYRNKWRDRDN